MGLRKCWLYRWLPCLVLLIQALQNVKSSYKPFSANQKSVRKGVFVIRNNATDIPVASFLFLNATVIIIIIVGIITIVIIITRNNATDLFYFYIPVASLLFLNAVIFLIIVVSLVSWSYKLDLNKYKEFNISILRLLQNGKHGGQGSLVGKCCWWWWLQWLWWLWLRRGGGEAVGGRVTSDTMEQLVGLQHYDHAFWWKRWRSFLMLMTVMVIVILTRLSTRSCFSSLAFFGSLTLFRSCLFLSITGKFCFWVSIITFSLAL